VVRPRPLRDPQYARAHVLKFSPFSIFSQDDKVLTDRLKGVCESLVVNNRNTSNFKTLIGLLLGKADFEKLEAEEK